MDATRQREISALFLDEKSIKSLRKESMRFHLKQGCSQEEASELTYGFVVGYAQVYFVGKCEYKKELQLKEPEA